MNDLDRRTILGATHGLSAAVAAGGAAAQSGGLGIGGDGPGTPRQVHRSSAEQERASPVDPVRPLSGRVAFVTGGARGIGRATAVELARLGADIAIVDIARPDGVVGVSEYPLASPDDLVQAERLVREQGRRALRLVADVREPDELVQAAERTVAEYGHLDIVVASAGVHHFGETVADMDLVAAQAMMDVNLWGFLHTVSAALPGLRRRPGGRVVVIGSLAGRAGHNRAIAYNATKWAVQGLMKCMSLNLAGSGITVNCVCPGPVDTPLHNKGKSLEQVVREDSSSARLPVSVLAPEDIARAVAFLAGPGGTWMSGATIDIDGGRAAPNLA